MYYLTDVKKHYVRHVMRHRVLHAVNEVLEWNFSMTHQPVHVVYFERQFTRTSEREGVISIKVTVYMKYELNRWLF